MTMHTLKVNAQDSRDKFVLGAETITKRFADIEVLRAYRFKSNEGGVINLMKHSRCVTIEI
ncbi:hypothetical protein GOL82_26190 [Sinorhizobium medicae]|nr:hypothetical protein [Sinorhizobium medicae]MDX0421102.1 hypothetical protein [Sinorhizobium medicae]MDX1034692.1 hypothetical protein [Sinorhizobium medicae]